MTAEGVEAVDYLFFKSKDNVIYQNNMSPSKEFMAKFTMKKSKSMKSLCSHTQFYFRVHYLRISQFNLDNLFSDNNSKNYCKNS